MLGVTQASGDFDTIKSTSNITIGAGSNWENIPESVAGVLETQACGDYMVQQYTTLSSGNRYWRFSVDKGNTWRSWFSSVVKNSDLVQYFESGSAIISQIPAGSSGAKTILFSTTKVSTPHVVLTTRESTPDKFALQVHSITKNGFSVVAVNNKTSVSDCNFEWIAVCN